MAPTQLQVIGQVQRSSKSRFQTVNMMTGESIWGVGSPRDFMQLGDKKKKDGPRLTASRVSSKQAACLKPFWPPPLRRAQYSWHIISQAQHTKSSYAFERKY
jgi:hypothetical protein